MSEFPPNQKQEPAKADLPNEDGDITFNRERLTTLLDDKEALTYARSQIQAQVESILETQSKVLANSPDELDSDVEEVESQIHDIDQNISDLKLTYTYIEAGKVPIDRDHTIYATKVAAIVTLFSLPGIALGTISFFDGLKSGQLFYASIGLVCAVVQAFHFADTVQSLKRTYEGHDSRAGSDANKTLHHINNLTDANEREALALEAKTVIENRIQDLSRKREFLVDKRAEIEAQSEALLVAKKALGKSSDDDAFSDSLAAIRRQYFGPSIEVTSPITHLILEGAHSADDLLATLKFISEHSSIMIAGDFPEVPAGSLEFRKMVTAILSDTFVAATAIERGHRLLATLDCISAAIELMRASDDAILKAADLSADNYNVILREDEAGL